MISNGDPANGNGVEFKELQMLTGSGELLKYKLGDGRTPGSYESFSYVGGLKRSVKRTVKKTTKKKGGIVGNFRRNQKTRQQQRATDSKNNAAAIAAMKKSAAQPGLKLPPLPKEKSTGLSMGAKVGIGVGIALVLGVAVYFVVKHKK